METIRHIEGLAAIAADYDAIICDVWGVVHDGVSPFEAAGEALIRFRKTRGPVLMLSNAPRPGPSVIAQMTAIGVPREAYDAVLTSGDAARAALSQGIERFLHIGPVRDSATFEGLDAKPGSAAEAQIILCTGLTEDEHETPEDYRALLTELAARGLVMLCANPDLRVSRGPKLVWCAGGLAALYESLGGRVTYFGKPHAPVYASALDVLNGLAGRTLKRARVLAIGDGLYTDIKGAHAAGVPALLVTDGVNAELFADQPFQPSPRRVAQTLQREGLSAAAFLPQLAWT